METLNNSQLAHEHTSLKLKMEHFKQENVLLKYRLSKMVDENEGKKFLENAEYFQNELLIIDVLLKKLFNELEEFFGSLPENKNVRPLHEGVTADYTKLKKSFVYFENKFMRLSKEFNEKMLENSSH